MEVGINMLCDAYPIVLIRKQRILFFQSNSGAFLVLGEDGEVTAIRIFKGERLLRPHAIKRKLDRNPAETEALTLVPRKFMSIFTVGDCQIAFKSRVLGRRLPKGLIRR